MGLISPEEQIDLLILLLIDCNRGSESDIQNGLLCSYSDKMTIDTSPPSIIGAIESITHIYSISDENPLFTRIGCFEGVEIIDFRCKTNIENDNVTIFDFFIKIQFQSIMGSQHYFEMISEKTPFSKEAKIEYQNGISLELFEI